MKIGIGGGLGPFRAGISNKGVGGGVGPFSAGAAWKGLTEDGDLVFFIRVFFWGSIAVFAVFVALCLAPVVGLTYGMVLARQGHPVLGLLLALAAIGWGVFWLPYAYHHLES